MASILKVDTIQDQSGNNIINENANTITIGASGDAITIPSGATFASVGIDDNATETTITIDSDERVKIVSGAPTQTASTLTLKDDVASGTGSKPRLGFQDSANTYLGELGYASGGTSDLYLNNIQNANLIFSTNNTERMRITSGGYVGIGNTVTNPGNAYLTVKPTSTNGRNIAIYTSGSVGNNAGIFFNATEGSGNLAEIKGEYVGTNTGHLKFNTSMSERMRIDSSGNVGIGTSSPGSFNSGANQLVIGSGSGNKGLTISTGTSDVGAIFFADGTSGNTAYRGQINYQHSNDSMTFGVGGSEAFRYALGGLIIGKTSGIITDTGNYLGGNNGNNMVRAGGTVCGFNREATDGIIIEFSGDGTVEGNISVSGTTVSYNGFTGTHWSRFTDNSTPTILRGTVLETLDEMCDWYNLEFDVTDEEGNTSRRIIPHVLTDGQSNGDTITYNHEGTDYEATIVKEADIKHMKSKVSDTVDAKNVYGVFVAYDEDGEGYNDFYVASVGSFVVRIKANETIAKGDLLQSNGDGTAKVQTDDNVKSSSFAKVLSTTIIETYEDGSYLVPCSLMC